MEAPWARVSINFYRHPRTRRLSKDAQHLYLASILHCVEFSTDGRFPADETPYLASVSRVRSSLADELLDAGVWVQQGDDEVLIRDFLQHQTSRAEIEAKSKKASMAAQARWNKEQSEAESEPDAERNAPSNAGRNASREEESREEKTPPGFTEFWAAYPNRVGKRAALKAFSKALKRAGDLETLLDGVHRYAENLEQRNVDKEFWAHPTTWLNQDRWEDELPDPKPEGDPYT